MRSSTGSRPLRLRRPLRIRACAAVYHSLFAALLGEVREVIHAQASRGRAALQGLEDQLRALKGPRALVAKVTLRLPAATRSLHRGL